MTSRIPRIAGTHPAHGAMTERMTAIILAAGGSRRAGQPKLLLRYEGTTLLRRSVTAALNAGVQATVVVLGASAGLLRPELAGLPVVIVQNDFWEQGLSSSLRCGLDAARDSDAALIMLADQPLITSSVLDRLLNEFRTNAPRPAVSSYSGTLGVPAVFHRTYFHDLLALSGDHGAREWIARHRTEVTVVEVPEAALDIDVGGDPIPPAGESPGGSS